MRYKASDYVGAFFLFGLAYLGLTRCGVEHHSTPAPVPLADSQATAACTEFATTYVAVLDRTILPAVVRTRMADAAGTANQAAQGDPKYNPLSVALRTFTVSLFSTTGDGQALDAVQTLCDPLLP